MTWFMSQGAYNLIEDPRMLMTNRKGKNRWREKDNIHLPTGSNSTCPLYCCAVFNACDIPTTATTCINVEVHHLGLTELFSYYGWTEFFLD